MLQKEKNEQHPEASQSVPKTESNTYQSPSAPPKGVPQEKEPTCWSRLVFPDSTRFSKVPTFLPPSRWQKDYATSSDSSNSQNQRKDIHKNSHTNQKQSRQYCPKPLVQTAQQSPLFCLVQLPRECGHWCCQPGSQVNQGPLLACTSWFAP